MLCDDENTVAIAGEDDFKPSPDMLMDLDLADDIIIDLCMAVHGYFCKSLSRKKDPFVKRYQKLLAIIQSRLSKADLLVDKIRYKFTKEDSDIILVKLMSVSHAERNPYFIRLQNIYELSRDLSNKITTKYLESEHDTYTFTGIQILMATMFDDLGFAINEIFPRIYNTNSENEVKGFIWLIDACKESIRMYQDSNDNIYQVPLSTKRKLFDDLCVLRKKIVESPSDVYSIIDEAYKDNFGINDSRR